MLPPNLKQLIRDVLMAYAETGTTPIKGRLHVNNIPSGGQRYACAWGALGISNGLNVNCVSAANIRWKLHARYDMDVNDTTWFMAGFDGSCEDVIKDQLGTATWQAFRAGRLCARLAFRAPPKEIVPCQTIQMCSDSHTSDTLSSTITQCHTS